MVEVVIFAVVVDGKWRWLLLQLLMKLLVLWMSGWEEEPGKWRWLLLLFANESVVAVGRSEPVQTGGNGGNASGWQKKVIIQSFLDGTPRMHG